MSMYHTYEVEDGLYSDIVLQECTPAEDQKQGRTISLDPSYKISIHNRLVKSAFPI